MADPQARTPNAEDLEAEAVIELPVREALSLITLPTGTSLSSLPTGTTLPAAPTAGSAMPSLPIQLPAGLSNPPLPAA